MKYKVALAGILVVLLGTGAAADDGRVVELRWASGHPRNYPHRRLEIRSDGGSTVPGAIPFGPDTELKYQAVHEGGSLSIDTDFDGVLNDEKPLEFDFDNSTFDLDGSGIFRVGLHATAIVYPPWAEAAGLAGGVRVHVQQKEDLDTKALKKEGESIVRNSEFHLAVLLHLEGEVVLGGRHRAVALHDGDGDLAFDGEDLLMVDLNGNLELVGQASSVDRVYPGRPFRARDETWVGTLDLASTPVRLALALSEDETACACPWKVVEPPPSGTTHEGKARDLAEIVAEYEEKRAGLTRRRGAAVVLCDGVAEAGRLGTPEAFAFLERAFKENKSSMVRSCAVRAMGDKRHLERAPVLLGIASKAKERDLTMASIEALHAMDAPGRDKVLVKIAKGAKDDSLFRAAVRHAAYTGTPEARAGLVGLMSRCSRSETRAYDLYHAATRYFADPVCGNLIGKAFKTKSPRLRALALADAGALPYPKGRDMALSCVKEVKSNRLLRLAVTDVLGAASDKKSLRALLSYAGSLKKGEPERVVRLLGAVRDPEGTDHLLDSLSSKDVAVRRLAAEVLLDLQAPGAGSVVADRIGREADPAVLANLVRAVGVYRAKEALPALLKMLRGGGTSEVVEAEGVSALTALGLEQEDVVRYLEEVMAGGSYEARLRVVDAAKMRPAPQTLPLFRKGLADEAWQVRLVAAQGLGRLRAKDGVPLLIERLGTETEKRIRHGVAHALFRITGESHYDVADRWRTWWAEAGADFEVSDEVPTAPELDADHAHAAFLGLPVVSDRCMFVIDMSGSMDTDTGEARGRRTGKTRFMEATEDALKVIEALPEGSRANVLLFGVSLWSWGDGLVDIDTDAPKRLKKFLREQRPYGGDALYDAVARAVKTRDVDTVYVVADGPPTKGTHVEEDAIVEALVAVNWEKRVVIHCVSYDWDSDLMRRIAAVGGGTYLAR